MSRGQHEYALAFPAARFRGGAGAGDECAEQQTRIQHGDGRFPGLATAVVTGYGTPAPFARTATYDGLGDLIQQVDYDAVGAGQHAVTTYEWHPRCAQPTRITRPMGDFVLIGYDPYACAMTSQQDGRGASSLVLFRYNVPGAANAARLLTSIVYPNTVVGRMRPGSSTSGAGIGIQRRGGSRRKIRSGSREE